MGDERTERMRFPPFDLDKQSQCEKPLGMTDERYAAELKSKLSAIARARQQLEFEEMVQADEVLSASHRRKNCAMVRNAAVLR